jgi:Ras-related protein Rab-18
LVIDPLRKLIAKSLSQEFSRQVTRVEAEAFAQRMNSLFIEASAKTNVNVNNMFQEVVEKIMDTPELWDPAHRGEGGSQNTSNGNGGMPGGVQIVGLNQPEGQQAGGCSC